MPELNKDAKSPWQLMWEFDPNRPAVSLRSYAIEVQLEFL